MEIFNNIYKTLIRDQKRYLKVIQDCVKTKSDYKFSHLFRVTNKQEYQVYLNALNIKYRECAKHKTFEEMQICASKVLEDLESYSDLYKQNRILMNSIYGTTNTSL